jgi:hypothetical protein
LPSFCSGLSAIEGLVLSELSRPFKLREFFALLKKLAALVTVLLLRFFSAAGPWSSLCRRVKNPAPGGENRLSRGLELSALVSVWRVKELSMPVSGSESTLSLGGLEEPLNILFSNPPCEEKLRRLLPASLIESFHKGWEHSGVGYGRGEDGARLT